MPSRRRSALIASLLLAACKESPQRPQNLAQSRATDVEDDADRTVVVAGHANAGGLYAADAEALQKNSDFFFRVFDASFTRKLADLPATGEVADDKKPMSGSYYPESTGGTDVVMVGGQSALQKYDDAFHAGKNLASQWERDKHTGGPAWSGHCNGFSAAGQRHPKEPTMSVQRGTVTFAPQDVKALMAEIHMSVDYEFLGGNRCELTTPALPGGRADPTVMGDCEDINPGTLHAAVTNWIGKKGHVLIMDSYAADQVWNYPVIKYEVTSQEAVSEADAKAAVTPGGTKYIFNPNATQFISMATKLTYVEALKGEILGKRYIATMDLTYILELNADGEIVGGEWTGASQKDHPDFLWVALEPLTANGTATMGNPNLDANEVLKIWAESIGADPANPPLDIKRPPVSTDWGTWPGFDVTLDGRKSGAVFAGKKTVMHIARRDALASLGVSLEVGLNGATLATLTGPAGADFVQSFNAGPGLNRLSFTWKKDGVTVDEEYLRFHVMR